MSVRIGVVGAGYWGPNLVRNVYQLPGADLAVICDRDEIRLNAMGQMYPDVPRSQDFDQVLANPQVDAVILATPAAAHFAMAQQALKAGKHVLVEKPLALTSQDARTLTELAQNRGLTLMVGHTFMYNPAVRLIKELVDEGEIGDVYYIYANRVNLGQVRQDINALWNIAPHDISILLYLLGAMPTQVAAHGQVFLQEGVEDVVFAVLYFPNNVIAHVHASWLDPSKVRRTTVVGSKKMIVYDDVASEGKVKIYDKGALRVGRESIYGEYQVKLHSGDIYIPKIEMSEPLRNECQHFVDSIQNGTRPLTDGHNGWQVVRILEAATLSLKQGGIPISLQGSTLRD